MAMQQVLQAKDLSKRNFDDIDADDENNIAVLPGTGQEEESEHDIAADEEDSMADGAVDEDMRSGVTRSSRQPTALSRQNDLSQAVYGEATGRFNEDQRDANAATSDEHF